jgi:Fe(3+) dicitrate transport protein
LRTDPSGRYGTSELREGVYEVTFSHPGFQEQRHTIRLSGSRAEILDVELRPAALSQQMLVSAAQIAGTAESLSEIPGAVDLIDRKLLSAARVFTLDEALRKVAGIQARGEEGFGLRPNIGIRGLNPTRSNKVLLLEDGVPLSYAPYGDNASYYHPPVDRFDSIEVVKGAGQILYGPMTVGGVVNYRTPDPPWRSAGAVTLTGGSRDYGNGHARWGNTWKRTGLLLDAMRKQGEGARDNVRSGLNDYTVKVVSNLTPRQSLGVKANYYGEDSRITYSGLREPEWAANPRQNPFRNDSFDGNRYGLAFTHTYVFSAERALATSVYGSRFSRDWWRQSSNSAQRPNDSADPACGGMLNLHTTCGNEGRLRDYFTWGVDPRLHVLHQLFGIRNQADLGVRGHFEDQERIQQNGATPLARSGVVVENNERRSQAYSTFVQNRFSGGRWAFTPGVRVEHVRYQRTNRLASGGAGVSGATSLTEVIPGAGVSFHPVSGVGLFTGIHRGFSPPRTEDVIHNNTGESLELKPELSWNYEAGVRARVSRRVALDATFFRMAFSNQVIPASVAGGIGAVLTNGGRTLHQGFEFTAQVENRAVLGSRHSIGVRVAYTYLPVARFEGGRFSAVPGFATVGVTGNRLPYAPRQLWETSVNWSHARGWNVLLEAVGTGRQFADDLNTVEGTADGQRGLIPGATIWNATANYPMEAWRSTFFVTTKNAFDRLYVVDRSRGLLPGSPRLVQAGVRWTF